MADHVRATPSTGSTGALFASDEMVDPIGSSNVVQVPLTKIVWGLGDTGALVSTNAGFPVQIMGSTVLTANVTNTVVVNVTNTVVANVTNTVVVNVTNTVVVDSELPAAGALADNAANPTAPTVGAALLYWDSTGWDRALGSSVDGLLVNLGTNNDVTITGTVTVTGTSSVTVASTVNVSGSTVHLGTGTNNIGTVNGSSVTLNGVSSDAGLPVRVMGSTTITANVTNTVVVNVTNTVVVDSELPAAGALADNTANPTAPAVAAHLMVWDSTAWDRLLGSSVDGMLVNLGANNDVTVASTVNVSGSTVALAAGTNNIGTVNGSSVTLNGVSSDAGLSVRIMGSTTLSVSGSTVSVSGSTISVSGSSVTLNGVSSDSGLPVRIMASTGLIVSGSTVSVSGSTLNVINGSTFLVQPQAYTAGGCSPYSVYATTTLISANIKTSSGQIYSMLFFNNSTVTAFMRVYDSTAAPASTDDAMIKIRGMIPGAQAGSTTPGGFNYNPPLGISFSTGIGIRITGGINDTDATALPTGGIYGNIGYK